MTAFSRRLVVALVAGSIVLAAGLASAQIRYSMAGLYGRNTGPFVDIPALGNRQCPQLVTGRGFGPNGTMTILPPPNFTVNGQPFGGTGFVANPYGCIPASTQVTTGGAAGGALATGSNPASFTIPTSAFSQAAPAGTALNTVGVAVPNVVQLATGFSVMGPASTPVQPLSQTMANGTNTAIWRNFRANAWMTQTGRVGANFTWCPGPGTQPMTGPNCTNFAQGAQPLIVKYTGGTNNFGGTMSLFLNAVNTGNLAFVGVAALPAGGVGFNLLGGMGSAFNGRGYAAYRTAMLLGGAAYAQYMLSVSGFISTVMSFLFPFPSNLQYNYQFPHTTGNVVVRNVNTVLGNPQTQTMTAMGTDSRTALGSGNITLVSGGLSFTTVGNFTPNLDLMLLKFVPEPASGVLLAAGGAFLFGLSRARRKN